MFTTDGKDRGLAALLTTASRLLGRLSGMVVDHQREELIRTLAGAEALSVEVSVRHPGRAPLEMLVPWSPKGSGE